MKFSNLNEYTFSAICDQLSLQKCLQLRQLNRQWNFYATSRCRRVTALKLFSTIHDAQSYVQILYKSKLSTKKHLRLHPAPLDNDLIVDPEIGNSRTYSATIARLFPNVQIAVLFSSKASFQCKFNLSILLDAWSSTLTCLIMTQQMLQHGKLKAAFSSLKALKSLYFFPIPYDLRTNNLTLASISPQLETLMLAENRIYNEKLINSALCKLNLPQLKQLTLKQMDSFSLYFILEHSITNELQYISNISTFTVNNNFACNEVHSFKCLQLIAANFTSLTELNLSFLNVLKPIQILPQLVKLPHLTVLTLPILFSVYKHWIYAAAPSDDIPRLNAIKELCLIFWKPLTTGHLIARSIASIFPRINMLTIDPGKFSENTSDFIQHFKNAFLGIKIHTVPYVRDHLNRSKLDLSSFVGRHQFA